MEFISPGVPSFLQCQIVDQVMMNGEDVFIFKLKHNSHPSPRIL